MPRDVRPSIAAAQNHFKREVRELVSFEVYNSTLMRAKMGEVG
jgi:hypothetical protein